MTIWKLIWQRWRIWAPIELKREFAESIKRTVIAFANSVGGRILVGIDDDGSVAGVTHRAALISRAVNSLQDGSGPDLTRFTDLAFEMMAGKSVLVIQVQRGTAMPYCLAGKGIRPESVFVRQGSQLSQPAEQSFSR